MKLKDILGVTSYLVYGGGNAHYKTDAVEKFKFQRFFVGCFNVTQNNLALRVEPTEQNFKYDTYLQQLKTLGITRVFSLQGTFDHYDTIGKDGKVCPIMEGADPLKQESWKDFGELNRQLAIRYADDTGHLLSEARVFQQSGTHLSNTPKAGLGLIDFQTGLNEINFKKEWSGATRTMTREAAAVCFKVQFDAIRSVSKSLKVVIPSSIEPTEAWLRGFLVHLKSLYQAEGKPMPTDFYLDFHWYMRNSSQDQSGGTAGETPETVNAYAHGQMMDALCDEYGLPGWMCTETGWATDNGKQSAPILEGYTREQSQGILMIRLALIWGASKHCKGISFWHCANNYDTGAYGQGGINYRHDEGHEDWTAKPARTICEEFLDKYGEWSAEGFNISNPNFFSIFLRSDNDDLKHFAWTDKKNYFGLYGKTITPFPQEIGNYPTPPMLTLTVVNKQLQWSDGQPCHLYHADSPESRLHPNYGAQFSAECKALPTYGVNTITVTMRGDDVTAISPWMNNNPAQGVDVVKLQMWYGQLKEFLIECEKNNLRGVIIAYLGERTNFKSISDQQYENWFVEMGKVFQDISGQIIFGWEEIWDGSDTNTMRFCDRIGSLLKSYLPNSLLMYHNNPGQKAFNAGSSFVKLVCIQETSISAMKATAQAALAKGFAVHFHEPYGLVKLSNTQDANKKIVTDLCAAAKEVGMKNVGIFASDYDLQAPDPNKLSYLYKHLSATLNGTTTNPTAMLKVSTSPSPFPGNIPLDSAQFPSGTKLYIYWDGEGKTPLKFMPSGQSESGKPYEYKGGAAVTFADGTHTVTVTDASGVKLGEASFTIGNTPPPPVDIKGLSFVLKPDGKIEFTFENGAKKLVQPI